MFKENNTVYVLYLSERHYCNGKLVKNTERLNNVIGVYRNVADAKLAALLYRTTNNDKLEYTGYTIVNNMAFQIRYYNNKTGIYIFDNFEIYSRTIE